MSATKHSTTCKRVFANYDLTCPRCVELDNGSPPRAGWGRALQDDARDRRWMLEHLNSEKHLNGGCGPVCTFGEW